MVVARAWEVGNKESVFNWYRIPVEENEKFWKWMVGSIANSVIVLNATKAFT